MLAIKTFNFGVVAHSDDVYAACWLITRQREQAEAANLPNLAQYVKAEKDAWEHYDKVKC